MLVTVHACRLPPSLPLSPPEGTEVFVTVKYFRKLLKKKMRQVEKDERSARRRDTSYKNHGRADTLRCYGRHIGCEVHSLSKLKRVAKRTQGNV